MDRRNFLRLGLAAIAAPAIVRATSLMPIKAFEVDYGFRSYWAEIDGFRIITHHDDVMDALRFSLPPPAPDLSGRAILMRQQVASIWRDKRWRTINGVLVP